MWPFSCVAPKTDCKRLKESMIYKNSETNGLSGQHTRILKSLRIKSLSTLGTIVVKKKSEDSKYKRELIVAGGSVDKCTKNRVHQIHPTQLYLKASKALHR